MFSVSSQVRVIFSKSFTFTLQSRCKRSVTDHLEQSQIGAEDVVEVDLRVRPGDVHLGGLVETAHFAVDEG